MFNTVASIVTGVLLISTPTMNETTQDIVSQGVVIELSEGNNEVSFAVSVNSTTAELEEIKKAAEEAGMGFTYKKRGVKSRLVIDMIIETADDYSMERIVVREEDGTKYLQWEVDEKGQAVAFIEGDNVDLTQHSK